MEDIFYCGEGDLSDAEENQTKVFVNEPDKIWRIKTREEFLASLGPSWNSYRRNGDGSWNSDGKMEWLLGKPLHEVMNTQEDREHWKGMQRISGEMEFKQGTRLRVRYNEGLDSLDSWTIWPYYDIVYDYPV